LSLSRGLLKTNIVDSTIIRKMMTKKNFLDLIFPNLHCRFVRKSRIQLFFSFLPVLLS
jgi:hypothetical protein